MNSKECRKIVNNLLDNSTELYNNIIAIEAEKSDDSLWPKELFRHDFKNKGRAGVYGLPDGSLLITGNKKLWKVFQYD